MILSLNYLLRPLNCYLDFEFGDGAVSFSGAGPPSAHALVALFDDVVGDGHAAVVARRLPLQHAVLSRHVLDNQGSHGSSGHVDDGDADVAGVGAVDVLGGEGHCAVFFSGGAPDVNLGVVGGVDDLDAIGRDQLLAVGQPTLFRSGFSGNVDVEVECVAC